MPEGWSWPKETDRRQAAGIGRPAVPGRAGGPGGEPKSQTPDDDFDDAYRVRRKLVDHLMAAGGRLKGHKVGVTAETMQKMFSMIAPDFGLLLDSMILRQGAAVQVSHLSNTRAEPELVFELARSLAGPGVTWADVMAATARIWAAGALADNAGAIWVILGAVPTAPDLVDFVELTLAMEVDGFAQSARANQLMGHLAAPLAFLANKLAELDGLGGHLKAGDIVITGAPARSVEVKAGSRLHADFGRLGTINLTFAWRQHFALPAHSSVAPHVDQVESGDPQTDDLRAKVPALKLRPLRPAYQWSHHPLDKTPAPAALRRALPAAFGLSACEGAS